MAFEADEHPYTSYNKDNAAPTLVGNWEEERALQNMTGTTRYETWAKNGEPATVYAERQDDATEMPTHPRVIEHTMTQVASQDWRTMYQVAHDDPRTMNTLISYKDLSTLGPRERQEYMAMLKEARQLPQEVLHKVDGAPIPPTLESTYRSGFPGQDVTGVTVGARVMKDPDGRPVVRDPTFLSETQIMEKHAADRLIPNANKFGATQTMLLPDSNMPITIYTEAIATGKYGDKFQGTRTLKTTNPFAKETNFTKPMSDYSKVVIDE